MAKIDSRQEFTNYCLRQLGAPVINVEIADEQIDDIIDTAIEFMVTFNYDMMEKKYLAIKITQPMIDNGYTTLPEDVLAVSRILPFRSISQNGGDFLFDLEYQITNNEILQSAGGDLSYLYIVKQHLATINDVFHAKPMHEFRRYTEKLYFEFDTKLKLTLDTYIVIECHTPIDTTAKFWNDKYLKQYGVLLFKRQWGQNLSKFNKVQLPGGVELRGVEILESAEKAIEIFEQDAVFKYSEPLGFFLG